MLLAMALHWQELIPWESHSLASRRLAPGLTSNASVSCHKSSDMCCFRSIHILTMSASAKLPTLLQLTVRNLSQVVHYTKNSHCNSFLIIGGISVSACSCLGSGCTASLDIHSPMNGILGSPEMTFIFYLVLNFLGGITASLVSEFSHDLFHQHHTLQLEHHLLYQINLLDLWILH